MGDPDPSTSTEANPVLIDQCRELRRRAKAVRLEAREAILTARNLCVEQRIQIERIERAMRPSGIWLRDGA